MIPAWIHPGTPGARSKPKVGEAALEADSGLIDCVVHNWREDISASGSPLRAYECTCIALSQSIRVTIAKLEGYDSSVGSESPFANVNDSTRTYPYTVGICVVSCNLPREPYSLRSPNCCTQW